MSQFIGFLRPGGRRRRSVSMVASMDGVDWIINFYHLYCFTCLALIDCGQGRVSVYTLPVWMMMLILFTQHLHRILDNILDCDWIEILETELAYVWLSFMKQFSKMMIVDDVLLKISCLKLLKMAKKTELLHFVNTSVQPSFFDVFWCFTMFFWGFNHR